MMGFGLLTTVLVVAGIAYALGWRPQASPPTPQPKGESALDILKARYARGEISQAEYDSMRQQLAV